jgi:hypothetical protein
MRKGAAPAPGIVPTILRDAHLRTRVSKAHKDLGRDRVVGNTGANVCTPLASEVANYGGSRSLAQGATPIARAAASRRLSKVHSGTPSIDAAASRWTST